MSETPPPRALSCPRDRHLFGPGGKRVLSLDGGGVRGIVSLAYLRRLEALIAEIHGAPVRLCDHFDLIGGTSTGAIIATALALGKSASEIRDFYFRMAPRIFKKPWPRVFGLRPKFDAGALRRELVEVIGGLELGSEKLTTGLALMLKRLDTGAAWIVSNNPAAKYWETPEDRAFIGNRHYELASLVRASTAAPGFFAPQTIDIAEGERGLFIDGGLTPHNDPSLALLMLVALPGHRLEWTLKPEALSFVSIGTGAFRPRARPEELARLGTLRVIVEGLQQQIAEGQTLTLTLMSWLGRGGGLWPINSEIGDLLDVEAPCGPLFRYRRYDVRLEQDWLREQLGLSLSPSEIATIRAFDDPDGLARLEEIGERAAERFMNRRDITNA